MARNELHVVLGVGPLGIATAEALLRRGQRVMMVNRSGKAQVPAGATVVQADLYHSADVSRVSAGAVAVYQCAQPAYTEWTTKFERLQSAIIEGVAATGAKLIVAENLYMYGKVVGLIHEDLPYNAHTRKGQVRARMAKQVSEVHRSGKLRTAAARGSDFFGPGVLGSALGERVFQPILAGKPAQITGRIDQPHSYTYITDFGEVLAILGEQEQALGQHWHVPNTPAITQQELIDLVAVELGKPVKVASVGRFMMSIAGLFIPEAYETVEMIYEFEQPFIANGERFCKAFGFKPTPIASALRTTLAWYHAHQSNQPAMVHEQ